MFPHTTLFHRHCYTLLQVLQLPCQYFVSQHVFIPPVLEAVTNNIANWVLAPIEECLGTQLMPRHRRSSPPWATSSSATCLGSPDITEAHSPEHSGQCTHDSRSAAPPIQFSSRWYLCAQKSPYALHPISLKFPQCCLWNSSKPASAECTDQDSATHATGPSIIAAPLTSSSTPHR